MLSHRNRMTYFNKSKMNIYFKLFVIMTNNKQDLLEICVCLQKCPVFLGRKEIERGEKKTMNIYSVA